MATDLEKLTVGPGEGHFVRLKSLGVRFILRGEQAGGRFCVVEHPIPPRSLAAPMHTHQQEDEYSYVLRGVVGAQVGGRVVRAEPGTFLFKPRGVPHTFWNESDEEASVLELISPAGFERYFEEVAEIFSGGGPPDEQRLGEVRQRYRLDVEMGSIETLIREHALRG